MLNEMKSLTVVDKSGRVFQFDVTDDDSVKVHLGSGKIPDGFNMQLDTTQGGEHVVTAHFATDEYRATIKREIIEELGTPVFGTVDGDKNITLSGDLAEGTYKLLYENADGTKTALCDLTVG